MKGSKWILAMVIVALLLAASPVWAQDPYAKPLDTIIKSGSTVIKYQGTAYNFCAQGTYSIVLEKVDAVHIKLTIRLIKTEVTPHLAVQWGPFQQADLGSPTTDPETFTLNSETGYAEK
jgi:hypothetical protein